MRVKVTTAVLLVAVVGTAGAAWAVSADPPAASGTSVTAPAIDTTPTGWPCEGPHDPTRTGATSVREVVTEYPANDRGQTYGPRFVGDAIGYPDLLAARALGFDGGFVDGYVLRCDADYVDSDGRLLRLFASDGGTVIGYWRSADNRNPVMEAPTRS